MDDIAFDIQFFKDKDGDFLPKEVAFGSIHKPRRKWVWIVAPPYEASELPPQIRLENQWKTENHHGIHWSEGGITLDKLEDELSETAYALDGGKIYARGTDAVKFLEEYMGEEIINVYDDDHGDFPTVLDPSPTTMICPWHGRYQNNHGTNMLYHCAIQNLDKMQKYLNPYPFMLGYKPWGIN